MTIARLLAIAERAKAGAGIASQDKGLFRSHVPSRTPVLALLVFSTLVACGPVEREPHAAHDPVASVPALIELEVPAHNPAIVSVPSGSDLPLPLLVATHGAWDRAEAHCELWRAIVGNGAFVLCPQGRRTDRRMPHDEAYYYYPDHHALHDEVLAAVVALEAKYPDRVDTRAAVYTGFSQGAIHGARVIVALSERFPRAALVEGGNGFFQEWSAAAARRYRAGGGERVLFGRGSPACVRTAERCASLLRKADVTARVVHAEGAGHSYGGTMQQEVAASFAWLVEGDARWER